MSDPGTVRLNESAWLHAEAEVVDTTGRPAAEVARAVAGSPAPVSR